MKRSGMKYAVLAVIILLLAFTTTPVQASSGTLHLTTNTTLTEDHYGNIVLEADAITLDCAGYKVIGPGLSTWGAGIRVLANGITVKRCTVTGFSTGYYAGVYSSGNSNGRYKNNKFLNNNNGLLIDYGNGDVIIGNTATGNTYGIVFRDSTQEYIEKNVATNNTFGFALLSGCSGNILSSNISNANSIQGFDIQAFQNSLVGNSAARNGGSGFNFLNAVNNEVYLNTSKYNQFGFHVQNASGNRFGTNLATNNQSRGFTLLSANGNTLFENTANDNNDFGFYAVNGSSYNKLIRNFAHDNQPLDAVDDESGVGNEWIMNTFGKHSGF